MAGVVGVRSNGGAPGVDGVTIDDVEDSGVAASSRDRRIAEGQDVSAQGAAAGEHPQGRAAGQDPPARHPLCASTGW